VTDKQGNTGVKAGRYIRDNIYLQVLVFSMKKIIKARNSIFAGNHLPAFISSSMSARKES